MRGEEKERERKSKGREVGRRGKEMGGGRRGKEGIGKEERGLRSKKKGE